MKNKSITTIILIFCISIIVFLIIIVGKVQVERPDITTSVTTATETKEQIQKTRTIHNQFITTKKTEEITEETIQQVIIDNESTTDTFYNIDYSYTITNFNEETIIEEINNEVVNQYNSAYIEPTPNNNVIIEDGWTYINEPYQWNSTYMGVHKITNTSSLQWQWLQSHDWYENDEGIVSYDGRILVALTPAFGSIGDYVDLLMADGSIVYCIIGDVKWNADTWGHWIDGKLNVLEIIVAEWWYNGHENKYYPDVLAFR